MTWQEYWATRSDGGHRSQAEEFLHREAAEKLFHLGSGKALLDLGCGSADLLVYYADAFTRTVGADFSSTMLQAARARIGGRSIELVEADDVTVWTRVAGSFDRITAGQVVQYLTSAQLAAFLRAARQRLVAGGRVVLFDVIDPRIYALTELGLFERQSSIARLRRLFDVALARLKSTRSEIGYRYPSYELEAIARACGFHFEMAWSMYYEYRYHAILDPA
jgi:cyclopropane-fatty-acyl-phospholipid synthase